MSANIFTLAKQLTATIAIGVNDSKNRLPIGIILTLLALLSLRSLVDELNYAAGMREWSMFLTPDDRFGDLLKAAMTYLTPAMVDKSDFGNWPDLFKDYLVNNPNFGPMRYNLHLLPVANLLLISVAKLILLAGPTQTLLLSFFIYMACVVLIAVFFAKSMNVIALDAFSFAFVMTASYPALFMLTRGNYNAGFTSLLLCSYVLTAFSGKERWLGWFALALALNMRPNTALLVGIEFIASPTFRKAVLHIGGSALLTLALFGLSYTLLNHIYPIYTIPNMLDGLRVYNITYVLHEGGAIYNLSVFGADKFLRQTWSIGPYYSHKMTYILTAIGLVMIAATVRLAMLGKLSRIEVAFLFPAFCVMFTPVFTLYHMVEFAAVLPLILQENRERGILPGRNTGLVLAISLLVLSPLGGVRVNGVICSILLLYGSITILYRGFHAVQLKNIPLPI